MQTFFYLIRRMIFAASIVYFDALPFIQAALNIVISMIILCYMIIVLPIKNRKTFIFEIYNEFTLLVLSYFLMLYADIITDIELRYNLGWFVIGITLLNLTVNYASMVFSLLKQTIKFVKKQKKNCKKKKATKEPQCETNDYIVEEITFQKEVNGKAIKYT